MDILIPAALEGQITRERAEKISCKLNPRRRQRPDLSGRRRRAGRPRGDRGSGRYLYAGGVTVSYFEWVQDMASFFWSEEEINAKMDRIMTDAIVHVCDKAAEKACSLRTAAYIVACERILLARKDRGIYPG